MPLQRLANSGINVFMAGDSLPPTSDGIQGAINEGGLNIWCSSNVQVLGVTTNGTEWQVVDTLGPGNPSVSVYWEDYKIINFHSLTGTSEKVRVMPSYIHGSSGGGSLNPIDEADEFSDVPEITASDENKYLAVNSAGNLSFVDQGSGTAQSSNSLFPIINGVNVSSIPADNITDIEIEGSNFSHNTTVYVFQNTPSEQQITNLTGFKTDIIADLSSHPDADVNNQFITIIDCAAEKILITNDGSLFGGIKSFGYKSPTKMVLRLSPSQSHVSNTYSILIKNSNGKRTIHSNCFSVV